MARKKGKKGESSAKAIITHRSAKVRFPAGVALPSKNRRY